MDFKRPYLIIPKLIEQPTWGGDYIIKTKGWDNKPGLQNLKIGQSYELFSGSNLSLALSSTDPDFVGEVTTSKDVEKKTAISGTLPLTELIKSSPREVIGRQSLAQHALKMPLLIKFTQALGNSFQIHIKDGAYDTFWQSKPESWYYFEPGFITLGVKVDTDWSEYQNAVTELQNKILELSIKIKDGKLRPKEAKKKIKELVTNYNPWQYVNLVYPKKDSLIDLSPCGIHHSWEEDTKRFPLGNVLYEIQLNIMDGVSTIRVFDKGKMAADGVIRPLHVDDYFNFIDRSGEANRPKTHEVTPRRLSNSPDYLHERLLQTKYYILEKVAFKKSSAVFSEKHKSFRHVFVKTGAVDVVSGKTTLFLLQGHSCFIPAASESYKIVNRKARSIALISY